MRFTSCFIGIPLPDKYQGQFEEILGKLGRLLPNARLVRPQSPHITLYYLDEQSQDDIPAISNIIEKYGGIVKGAEIGIKGWGVFDPDFVRVLFAKVEHNDSLFQLNQQFRQYLSEFYAEDNNLSFHAHVTLARLPNDEVREEFIANDIAIKELLYGINWNFKVSELVLYGVDSTQEIEYHQKLTTVKM